MIDPKIIACLIVPTHWLNQMGGSRYQVKCLTEALAAKGDYDVHVLSRSVSVTMPDDKYTLHNISEGTCLSKYAFFWDTFQLLRCQNAIKLDVIYQRVGCAYTGVAAYYARKHNCKMIWRIAHDKDVDPAESFSARAPHYAYH